MPRRPDANQNDKNDRNEYIPSFITKKPFYVPDDEGSSSTSDYLEHQRLQESKKQSDSKWYDRGRKLGPAATKYRKGACENCGAMTHKTKECLSRPRKHGARWTGKDIQADEVVQDISLGWDAKRDRWNGYDPSSYTQVIEDYEEVERMKKRARLDTEADGENGDGDEEEKYAEESDMGRVQGNSTRQLRLREDTAKYLLNLDLDSARYDPKTRSMVDSGTKDDLASALVADENFMKASGDVAEFQRAQQFAWKTQERGGPNQVHLQANPTGGLLMMRKEEEEARVRKEAQKKALLEKYGGGEHLNKAPLADAVMENERYVEYDEHGGIKGISKKAAKSKYAEDIFPNNHTSVWGSWWKNFQWGFACCHSTIKNSYCTGESGKAAFEETENMRTGNDLEAPEENKAIEWRESHEEQEVALDNARKAESNTGSKKRSAREIIDGVSEEDLEKYRQMKALADDPMAKMLGKNQLLDS